MEPTSITAGRLHLRPWRAGDEPELAALHDQPDVARWTPHPSPYTLEHAAARIAGDPGRWADGTRAELAVREATSGALLGAVGLYPRGDGTAQVGWVTAAAARDQGVASAAVRALCGWAFGALGLLRLEATVDVGNWASRRVAEKAGLRYEGTVRGVDSPGTWTFSRLPGDEVVDTARLPAYPDRTDGVVTLRRWRSTDAADVARACSDPEIARWLPVPVPYTLEVAQDYVGQIVPHEWAEGLAANCAVLDATSGTLVGAVGLKLRDGIGEVGYWVAPWARGRGIAGRAARLHAQWGFTALGLVRVELLADVDNLASQRAAEKAGWVQEGVARAIRVAPREERRVDMVVFGRLPQDP